MSFDDIVQKIVQKFGEDSIVGITQEASPPIIHLVTIQLVEVCRFLHQSEGLYFDYLTCITGIDNGPEAGTMDIIYTLNSIPYEHQISLKVEVTRNQENAPLPAVPSVIPIWRSADWHEREIYDLLGIHFTDHPDLRRILLPHDWQGYPLRKDYQEQETYHGIGVRYEKDNEQRAMNS